MHAVLPSAGDVDEADVLTRGCMKSSGPRRRMVFLTRGCMKSSGPRRRRMVFLTRRRNVPSHFRMQSTCDWATSGPNTAAEADRGQHQVSDDQCEERGEGEEGRGGGGRDGWEGRVGRWGGDRRARGRLILGP